MGGVVQAVVDTASNVVNTVVDDVGSAVNTVGNAVGKVASGAVNVVHDAGSALNNFVKTTIPGGWVGVGAAALLAVGVTDPEILGAADNGTVTSTMLENAGYDPGAIQTGLSNLTTESQAAGFGANISEYQTAATAGFHDAAEYDAATSAGFTNATEYNLATSSGFTNAAEYNAAQAGGFTDAATYNAATHLGYATDAAYTAGSAGGFVNAAEYNAATSAGFTNAANYTTAQSLGIGTNEGYQAAIQEAGFTSPETFNTAVKEGFSNAATYNTATAEGFTNADTYNLANSEGFNNAATYHTAEAEGFTDANTYHDATQLGYNNATDYTTGTSQGYANAHDYTLGSGAGFQNAAQWQTAGAGGYGTFADYSAAAKQAGFTSLDDFETALNAGFGDAGSGVGAVDWETAQAAGIPTYAKYAAAVGAGMIIPNLMQALPTNAAGMGPATPYTWGHAAAPINPGANPGLLAGQVNDFYNNAPGSLADTYYWGVHNPLNGTNNISGQYNTDTNAPATPFGAAQSAVGGNEYLNIPQFVQNTIGNPSYQKMTGSPGPYETTAVPAFSIPASYYTDQTQAVNPGIGQSYGGPRLSPLTIANPTLNTLTPVAPAGATNAGQPV